GYGAKHVLDISFESDLTGMGIDLPAPVGKARADSRVLKAHWGPVKSAAGRRDQLSVNLGADVALLLEHDRAAPRGTPYFSRGALGVNRPATLASAGLAVDIETPELD